MTQGRVVAGERATDGALAGFFPTHIRMLNRCRFAIGLRTFAVCAPTRCAQVRAIGARTRRRQRDALCGLLAENRLCRCARSTRVNPTVRSRSSTDTCAPSSRPRQSCRVLVLDVDEQEALKLLATLDPLAAMAEADASLLAALVADVRDRQPSRARHARSFGRRASTL